MDEPMNEAVKKEVAELVIKSKANAEFDALTKPRLGDDKKYNETEEQDQYIISSILPFWNEGKRNQLTMNLSGLLRKKGYKQKHTEIIITELCHATNDKELPGRLRTVQETYKKDIKNIQGYEGLIEIIPQEIIEKISSKKKKKNEIKDEKRYTSCRYKEGILYEQCYDPKTNQSFFINNEGKMLNYFLNGECEYWPIQGEELEKNAVLLPTGTEEYGTDEQLDNDIKNFVNKWLDIPPEVLQFAIWNIKRSWVYERFHTLNYLRALGDTGQGKSRFLDTLGVIHYKPIFTSGASTAAPIFRIIDKWRGTMIFDECDLKVSEETADIIKVINQGYERGKSIMRCDQNDASKINFFDPFCPKIIATRKPFTDKAVESRCITQVMTGTKRKDIKFSLDETFYEESQHLRNKLLLWRFRNYDKIKPGETYNIDVTEFEPRVQQIITSYVSLFGNDTKQMEQFKLFIKNYQEELIDERQNSWEGQIVIAINSLLEKGIIDISAQDIIEAGDLTNDRGQHLKPRALSNVLKELGFGKGVVKRVGDSTKRCIPIVTEHINSMRKRYGVTVVTFNTESSAHSNNIDIVIDEEADAQALRMPVTTVTTKHKPQTELTETTETTVTEDYLQGIFTDDEIVTWLKKNPHSFSQTIQKRFDITYERLKEMSEKGLIFESKNDRWNAI